MGSPFRLVFYAEDDSLAGEAADLAFILLDSLNETLSDYRDGSEINRLSASSGSGKWVKVSDDLYAILRYSKRLSLMTQGTFDVTVGPVVQLWRRSLRRNTFPDAAEIATARRSVGYRFMKFRSGRRAVKLTRPNMRLDVGGIGKGYAADRVLSLLRAFGINSAMLDAGGDITLGDPPPGQEFWSVDVRSGAAADTAATVLSLSRAGVATSGATYRYLEHEGIRYSHIVNPKTGVGLRFHVRTTVVAPSGMLADALATALSVAGVRKSKRILRHFPGVKVWLLENNDGKITDLNTLK